MNSANIPMEISIGGIYFPPIMFAILLGVVLASVIAKAAEQVQPDPFHLASAAVLYCADCGVYTLCGHFYYSCIKGRLTDVFPLL